MEPEVVQARAVVCGRVQMVGFRAYVLHHAANTGLRGTVRNQRDGTLEVMLEGPLDAVENLIRLLHRGPSAAHVDRVDVEYQAASGELPPMRVTA